MHHHRAKPDMSLDGILDQLNDSQREAVTHVDGPLLVVAGAGSGKTRVVTRRMAHLIASGVAPWKIVGLTFTNKAAKEMRGRVENLVGAALPWVGTFHSVCARWLRRDLDGSGGDPRTGDFTIFDTEDQQRLLKQCLAELGLEDKYKKPAAVLEQISAAKRDLLDEAQLTQRFRYLPEILDIIELYERQLRLLNAMDFDDLIAVTVRQLQARPRLREQYQERHPYLLVDEYQDTNRMQYILLQLLVGPGQNLHVTGDPDQSIYSWRGADFRNILDFRRDYPNAKMVKLETNYRSTQTILNAANSLIRNNRERIAKNLVTENGSGQPVRVGVLDTDRDEAEWILNHVLLEASRGRQFAEMAVLYRTNAQSRVLEESLLRSRIPYQVVGGIKFYARREVKDALAHLRLLVNPGDTIALQRVVSCRNTGVGPKTLESVCAAAAEHDMPPFALLAHPDFRKLHTGRAGAKLAAFATWCQALAALPQTPVRNSLRLALEHSGLLDSLRQEARQEGKNSEAAARLENLNALEQRAAEFDNLRPEGGLREFLQELALLEDTDSLETDRNRLTLMTLHCAKGLEFPTVFIAGVEVGLLPHKNSEDSPGAEEEERRLFYVGITRAGSRLFLSSAGSRYHWGEFQPSVPSPFLEELGDENLEYDLTFSAAVGRNQNPDRHRDSVSVSSVPATRFRYRKTSRKTKF